MTEEIVIRLNKHALEKAVKIVSVPLLVIFSVAYTIFGVIGLGIVSVMLWVGRRGVDINESIDEVGGELDAWAKWIIEVKED